MGPKLSTDLMARLLARLGCALRLTVEGRSNAFKESFVVERFCEKLHCAASHRLHPHLLVTMCGDEDNRNPATIRVQLRLQFEPGDPRHANIRDQAGRLVLLSGIQKRLRRRKILRW